MNLQNLWRNCYRTTRRQRWRTCTSTWIEVKDKSKLKTDPRIANADGRPNHIQYAPETAKQIKAFGEKVNHDLKLYLLGIDDDKLTNILKMSDWEMRRDELQTLVHGHERLWEARRSLDRHAMIKWIAVEQAIPCVLHLKLRVVEKLLNQLLNQAWERLDGSTKKQELFQERVQTCMRTQVLGTPQAPAQWRFPEVLAIPASKGGGTKLGRTGMSGRNAKKILVGLRSLVDVAFSGEFDDSRKEKKEAGRIKALWYKLLDAAVPMIQSLDRKGDWTDEEIFIFHSMCCLFMVTYVEMFFGDGITNYIHLLGAGHITYYLFEYRNLAKFQQQGWEALNKLIILYYHHNTNRGGSKGNSQGAMERGDHIGPLMCLLQRRYMWLLGHGRRFFLNEGEKGDEEEEDNSPYVI